MNFKKNMKSFKLTILFLSIFIFSGCGLWENFTTYFNLYYNASEIFNRTEKLIIQERKDIFSFTEPNISSSFIGELEKVIEKCSRIMQFSGESAFVDEALFLIGKSFYYQKNYVRANRKFRELVVKFPESELSIEAELWIAKTELQMRNFDFALNMLDQIRTKAKENEDDEILTQTYIERVKYFMQMQSYSNAIIDLNELLIVSKDSELNAAALIQLGELYSKLDDYENAKKSYLAVLNYTKSFDTELLARVKYGVSLVQLDRYNEALDLFIDLRNDDKNKTSFDIIELNIGITYRALGDFENALHSFRTIDTTFSTSIHAGGARYELGELFEEELNNFDSAHFYYQKAFTSSSSIDYIPLIRKKQAIFSKYQSLRTQLNNNLRDFNYATDSLAFIRDSITYALHLDSLEKEKATTTPNVEQGVQGQQATGRGRDRERLFAPTELQQQAQPQQVQLQMPQRPFLKADSLRSLIIKNNFDLGNLFFTEFELLDSAYYYYSYLYQNYDTTYMRGRILFSLGNYYLTVGNKNRADSIFHYIYDNFQNESIVNAAAVQINKPLIQLDLDLAEKDFVDAESIMKNNEYEKAIGLFYNIFLEHPKSQYAPKALLAMGFVLQEKLMLKDSAASIYDTLISRYPSSQHAASVILKFQMYKQERIKVERALQDSLARIEQERLQQKMIDSIKTAEQELQKHELEQQQQITSTENLPDNTQPTDSLFLEMNQEPIDTLRQEPPEESPPEILSKNYYFYEVPGKIQEQFHLILFNRQT
ncbi:MAG: hypothetical protein C0425_03925 [Chlorobiaceae bacterium]|nr:hypothetical protein [Chlorobiaceae bacterium]MBA4309464.1 hypothetical protein [Chlorobiaceae bacterium]